MKNFKIFFVALLSIISVTSYAQDFKMTVDILPLDECIALAIDNAPELKGASASVDEAKALKHGVDGFWLFDNLAVTGNTSYVQRDNLEDSNGENSYFGPQYHNMLGLTLSLPLNTWRTKKSSKNAATAVIEQTKSALETQILLIKSQVIQLYKEFEQASIKVNTAASNLEAQKAALLVAEEDFKAGTIDIEKRSNVKFSETNAKNMYIDSKTAFELAYHALKLRVGQEILKK